MLWVSRPSVSRFSARMSARISSTMLPLAHLVVAPYNYILAKDVREKLLEQMQVELEDLIVIVDEAHNLPDRAREEESFSIDAGLITGVRQERKSFGNPKLAPNLTLDKFLEALFAVLADGAGRCEGKDSVEVGREFLIESLRRSSGLDQEGLTALVANLFNHGQTMIEMAVKEGKEPPSSTLHLAERLMSWSSVEATRFLFLARNGEQMGLEAVCSGPLRQPGRVPFLPCQRAHVRHLATFDAICAGGGPGRPGGAAHLRIALPEGESIGALRQGHQRLLRIDEG